MLWLCHGWDFSDCLIENASHQLKCIVTMDKFGILTTKTALVHFKKRWKLEQKNLKNYLV